MNKEIALMQKLSHPNIVAYLGQDIRPHELFIFMELMPTSLFEIIQMIKLEKQMREMFSVDETVTCISQLAKGKV